MLLESVNVGSLQVVQRHGKPYGTGIVKTPAAGAVQVGRDGIAGDVVANTKHHGGPDQAVYLYGSPDLAWWSARLGRTLEPGIFGENLTVSGLESAALRIGDRLRIGAVTLEVTAPRIPCGTLAWRMRDPKFVVRFQEAERPGAYCRVLEPGVVQAGDAIDLAPAPEPSVKLLDVFRLWYAPHADANVLRGVLRAPLAERARREYEERLERAESGAG